MTCLSALYTFLMIIFWMIGTSSRGISTPISPLATMIPSDTLIMSSILSTPCIFSILAMILILSHSYSSRIFLISSISSADLTNDAAMKSKSFSIPKIISALSTSLMYGMVRLTLGTFTPLWFDTGPPFSTRHTISLSVTFSIFIFIRPSSMSMVSPGLTSFTRFLYVMDTFAWSPTTSSVVSVNVCPSTSSTLPSLKSPTLISGPLVSSSVATGSPSSSRSFSTLSLFFLCWA